MSTIKEVAEEFSISQDTLRYYERIKLLPTVPRTSGGIRNYGEEDKKWIEFIKCMRGAGLSIEALIEYVALFQEGDATLDSRKRLLMEQRDLLAQRVKEMQETLHRLNKKIETYETKIIACERRLSRKEGENK